MSGPRSSIFLRTLRRYVAVLGLAVAIVLFAGAGDEAARFNQLGHQLMCVCGCGQILLDCNHIGCTYSERMRAELTAAMQRGDNDSLILQSFVQKYGPTVLAAPTTTGFNRVAWLAPFVALCGGIVLTIAIVRKLRHKRVHPAVVLPSTVDEAALDALRRRVQRETQL